MRNKADIICLQETHAGAGDVDEWRHQWGDELIMSNGTSEFRGVGFKRNTEIDVSKVVTDSQGRYIICQFSYKKIDFLLVNLYAPNRDDPDFLLRYSIKFPK